MKFSNIPALARIRMIYENRSDPDYAGAFADLYWHVLLFVACVVVVGISIYGASTFFRVLSQLAPVAASTSATSTATSGFNTSALDSTLAGFAARQAQFQALQQNPPQSIADPSQSQ